jgi:hypothetical protein
MLDDNERSELLNLAGRSIARGLPGQREALPERAWSTRLLDPHDFVMQLKRKANWSYSDWPPGLIALRYATESFCSRGWRVLAA